MCERLTPSRKHFIDNSHDTIPYFGHIINRKVYSEMVILYFVLKTQSNDMAAQSPTVENSHCNAYVPVSYY